MTSKKTFREPFSKLLLGAILFSLLLIAFRLTLKMIRIEDMEHGVHVLSQMTGQNWPTILMSSDFAAIERKKIIYSHSAIDCEQCTISHLRLLKEIEKGKSNGFDVQVVGSDSLLYFSYRKYKKLLNLEYQFTVIEADKLNTMFQGIELPFFAVLDGNNRIILAWKAEVERIHLSQALIARHM